VLCEAPITLGAPVLKVRDIACVEHAADEFLDHVTRRLGRAGRSLGP